MTLDEAGEIFSYWERNPPAHLMLQTIARMLGWTPGPSSAGTPRVDEIVAAAPPGLAVARGGGLGMPAPLDLQALRTRNRAPASAAAARASD
ncbi:MAG TPA: hypothetical protein VGQ90_08135 [Stellaceae bacterium]|nr:hypothetical protein [Stellaceae bacterium]